MGETERVPAMEEAMILPLAAVSIAPPLSPGESPKTMGADGTYFSRQAVLTEDGECHG